MKILNAGPGYMCMRAESLLSDRPNFIHSSNYILYNIYRGIAFRKHMGGYTILKTLNLEK